MKTVTIPTCANPFVVIINGKKYTYPAGETMEVPDEVAEVIERHEEAHPKPDPAPDSNGGCMNCDDILAAAKAYTDKKVAEGGGSGGGGGLPVVDLETVIERYKVSEESGSKISGDTQLSDADVAKLMAVLSETSIFILRWTFEGGMPGMAMPNVVLPMENGTIFQIVITNPAVGTLFVAVGDMMGDGINFGQVSHSEETTLLVY